MTTVQPPAPVPPAPPHAPAVPAPPPDRPGAVLVAAATAGTTVQLLVWGAWPGLAALLCVGVVLGAAAWVARARAVPLVPGTRWVAGAVLLAAAGMAVRADPLTTSANVLVVLVGLAVLAHTWSRPAWPSYGPLDWLVGGARFCGHQIAGAGLLAMAAARRDSPSSTAEGTAPPRFRSALRRALPAIRGVALAVPVLILFTALLASADAVFADGLQRIIASLGLPDIGSLIGRIVVSAFLAWAVAGALWHLLRGPTEQPPAERRVPRFVGFTEAAIVLGAVDALFVVFVAIQARWFFGGADVVVASGLTYAEYARRGFAELVVVAVASLVLHLTLAGVTRRTTRGQQRVFLALTAALSVTVLVILTSAFGRLLLYESAFGFTRTRIAVHVLMVWIGLLVVGLFVLTARDRLRWFTLAAVIATLGFTATLNVVGVDDLIVRQNLARAQSGAQLDASYLSRLSVDAIPALVAGLATGETPDQETLEAALPCIPAPGARDWRSLRLADLRADRALGSLPDTVVAGIPECAQSQG